jgi:hypothetical protein
MSSLGNMVLDSKGYPHFICTHDNSEAFDGRLNNTLLYTSWNGASWSTQSVVQNISEVSGSGGLVEVEDIFTGAYLSLDSHDVPHIAYASSQGYGDGWWGQASYATWTGKEWNIQAINSTVVAESCYLVLDSLGNPHVSLVGTYPDTIDYSSMSAYSWIAPITYATTKEPQLSLTSSPTPANNLADASKEISQNLVLLTAIITVLTLALIALVLIFRRHRKTTDLTVP